MHGCRRGGQEWTRARLTVGGRRGALSTHSRRGPQRRGGGAGRAEVTMVDSRLSSTRWSSGLSRALASSRRSLSCVTSRSPRYSVGGIPSRSDDAPSHATTPASWVKSTCLSAGAAEELEAAPPLEPSPLPIHCLMSPPCDLTLAFGPRIGGARSRNTDGNSRATLATACAPTPSAPNLVGVDIQQTAGGNKYSGPATKTRPCRPASSPQRCSAGRLKCQRSLAAEELSAPQCTHADTLHLPCREG